MNEKADSRHADELLLIDYVLGRCEPSAAGELERRLQAESALRELHAGVRHTFGAVGLSVEQEPPADLAERTMARIRAARQTDALLAREQLGRRDVRDVVRPTFSLRELGAVAAVALLLVGIFGISVREAERRRSRNECASNMARVGAGLLTYANQNEGYLPATGQPERRWMPARGQPAVSNSTGLFRLASEGFVAPPAFQCPAVGGESFVLQAGMTDFPHPKAVSYSYQHSLGSRGMWLEDGKIAPVRASLVVLADDNPLFQHGRFHRDRIRKPLSDNHDGSGQNVLYLSGGVEFQVRPSVGVQGNNIYLAEGVYEYDGDESPTSPIDTFLLPAFSQTPQGRQGGQGGNP